MGNKLKSRSTAHRATRKLIVLIEVIVMMFALVASFVYAKFGSVNTSEISVEKIKVNEIDEEKYTGFTNIALFGLDSRDLGLGAGHNSDAIIILSINNDTNEIKMASVYRDTYLAISPNGYQQGFYNNFNKANSAYCYGGPEQALSMLNTNLDLNLTQYVTTNWGALIETIDMLGGLDLELTSEEVHWINYYQKETAKSIDKNDEVFELEEKDGVQHVNGVQATSFCRIRYTSGDDYKRTERQRYVLEKMFEKAKTMDLSTLNDIADKVFPMVSTNIQLSNLIKLGTRLLDFKISDSFGFPYEKGTGPVPGCGDCVFSMDLLSDVKKLHMDLFGEENYSPTATVQDISQKVSFGSDSSDSSTEENNADSYSQGGTQNYNYQTDTSQDQSYNDQTQAPESEPDTGGSEDAPIQEVVGE